MPSSVEILWSKRKFPSEYKLNHANTDDRFIGKTFPNQRGFRYRRKSSSSMQI